MRISIPVSTLAALAIGSALAASAPAPSTAATASASPAAAPAQDTVKVGQVAPDFSLPNQEGKPTSLKDFSGKWVVLYFYPKDFTGGCTLEAHNFQRDIDAYAKDNAVIVGVSVDSVGSHKAFCAKEGLNFKLLSDTSGAVSGRYASLREGKKMSARHTFIVDPQGKIAREFMDVMPANHSGEVLAALGDLRKK